MHTYQIGATPGVDNNWLMRVTVAVPSMAVPVVQFGEDVHPLGRILCVCPDQESAQEIVSALEAVEGRSREHAFGR